MSDGKNYYLEHPLQLRCGLSIFPSHDQAIDQILSDLLQKALARYILLTDVTGQFISAKGERRDVNPVALGALAAGDLAASREIARMSGEYQEHQMIIREGSRYHTIIYEVGSYLLLLVQVASDVPLGWVRVLMKEYAEKINRIILTVPEKVEEILKEFSNSDIQTLVDDMLDNLWKE